MLNKRAIFIPFFAIIVIWSLPGKTNCQTPVKIWEESVVIPTYLIRPPDKNPIFYTGRAYQGAQGRVYPYAYQNQLTDSLADKEYKGLFLENEFIKLCVLPELGGKLYYAVDKSNGYDIIYRNRKIKPALIGMLGAWTSGGVEWNIPHHHRASTFMPVDYRLVENPDGSKTIWIGELEIRHRTRWMVGITIYPGRSYIETTQRYMNRTPEIQSFLVWANTAVHANENYQVIFPPGTEYATYHSKVDFSEWPLSNQVYRGTDFRGVDISWWKNHPGGISFFAWESKGRFVAGIDHGRKAGISVVSNPGIVPGKKLWNWGTGRSAKMWDKILSDDDGPYLEIMTGAYSDNQPDYSWCHPFMVKESKMYFIPVRGLDDIKESNLNGSLDLEVIDPDKVRIGVHLTSEQKQCNVVLKDGQKLIFNQKVDIDPAKPYNFLVDLSEPVDEQNLSLLVSASDKTDLISYCPVVKEKPPMPEVVQPPGFPQDIETVEELCLTGLRLEQFYNPSYRPEPYYLEALSREPGNALVNTQLGILYIRQGKFDKAEERLRLAVERIAANYTRPKSCEALYYLGIALFKQEKYDEAYDSFYKAAWDYAWHSPAYYYLACIECLKGNYQEAFNLVNNSLSSNSLNPNSLNLELTILRRLGKTDGSEILAKKIIRTDPLNHYAQNELYLAKQSCDSEDTDTLLSKLRGAMRDEVQNYLELAIEYGNSGFYTEAVDVLKRASEGNSKELMNNSLIYYFLGYYSGMMGQNDTAMEYYRKGSAVPSDYCFPFRYEAEKVLKACLEQNPNDALTYYYLGNLYYDNQPELAVKVWETAGKIDNSMSILHRNLAFAYYYHNNDLSRAIEEMEFAQQLNPDDPRYYAELDFYHEMAGIPAEKRLQVLEKNHDVIENYDDALGREVILQIVSGKYDEAIMTLKIHHFRKIEGVGNIHNAWVDAHLLKGTGHLKNSHPELALKDFETTLNYPVNLEIGSNNREMQSHFFIGLAWEAMGEEKKANEEYNQAVGKEYGWGELKYYQALAWKKLANSGEADAIFNGLINQGKSKLKDQSKIDFFAKFGESRPERFNQAEAHYLIGLGNYGMGNKRIAEQEFKKVLELNPSHPGVNSGLYQIF